MRGYLLPPATGLYNFWIASQDDSELWLGTSTNPASMRRIAFIAGDSNQAAPNLWTNYPSQASAPVPLTAGYAYYLEARLKAGNSSNYLGVAWACPSAGIPPQIVPGQYLSPFQMNYVPHPLAITGNVPRNAIAGYQVGTYLLLGLRWMSRPGLLLTERSSWRIARWSPPAGNRTPGG